jgi:hypothetical protein
VIRRPLVVAGLVLLVVAACSSGASSPPSATPGPTTGPVLSIAELKVTLIDAYGPLWYCDPDFYPIQRADEIDSARERWPDVMADAEAFKVLATRLGLDPAGPFTDEARLIVYRAWKVLNAILLDPIGNDTYRFDYLAQPADGAAEGTRTAGTIAISGAISVEQQAAALEPICPICLTIGTLIDTPDGAVPVEMLRIGDPVWTLDADGTSIRAEVTAVGSTEAPAGHRVAHVILADGRAITASPGHPLADGRLVGDVRAGDTLDGSIVVAADLDAYDATWTYDIAVSGPTGVYLAGGIPLGSTLQP